MSVLTKQALAKALKSLLLEKPLNRVTVGDIAKECGVNRQTFYYHFRDIPDLVVWMVVQEAKERFSDFKDRDVSWEEGFMILFDLMLRDKKFILNIYHSVSLEHLQEFLYELLAPSLRKAVEHSDTNKVLNDGDKKFATDFYKFALAGIILDWIKHDMREDPEKIVSRLAAFFDNGVELRFSVSLEE